MASKVPWRTIIISGETGRFTREQIQAAVRAVMEKRKTRARTGTGKSRSSTRRRSESQAGR